MSNNVKKPNRLWTKYYILILVFSLFVAMANSILMISIPLYNKQLGGDNSGAGLMMGAFMVAAILFRPFFGNLSDTKSRRIVLVIGTLICTIMCFSYMFAFSVGMLIIFRALNGIGFSANTNASGTIVSDIVPSSRLAEGIGYFGLSMTIATAIGPALSLFIISHFNYTILFLFVLVILIGGLLITILIDYEKKNIKYKKIVRNPNEPRKISDSIIEKTALPTALVIVFAAFAMGSISIFIPTYALSKGIENIGIYFTVSAIALFVSRLFAGRIADRYGESMVVIPGLVLTSISFVILSFANTLPIFLLSGAFYGIGYGAAQPTLNAIMIKMCPKDRRGSGSSTFYTAMDLGFGGGSVVWGYLSLAFGFQFVYLTCAVSILVSLTAYLSVLRKQLRNHKNKVITEMVSNIA